MSVDASFSGKRFFCYGFRTFKIYFISQLSILDFSVAYWLASWPYIQGFPGSNPDRSSGFSDHFILLKRFHNHPRLQDSRLKMPLA